MLALVCASLSLPVSALTYGGNCGTNLTWSLNTDTGVLTISGTGAMNYSPWYEYRSSIKSAVIGDGVTSIGGAAFAVCSSLTSINIPNSVTTIGYNAFYNCSSLTRVNITDLRAWCNISFGDPSANPLSYDCGLYVNGELQRNIVIPEGTAQINSYAFYGYNRLKSVTIPDSVTSIGNYAFSGCSGLTSINIPDGVTSIGNYAFDDCSSLTSINIPDGVTSIGDHAFSDCSSLTSINIPDGVTSIGDGAFSGCSGLTSINIPDSVTSIGGAAFSYCSSLTSINIPNSVTSIGNHAFYYCSSLTSINIPNSVTSIGSFAFEDCTSLTSISIPKSVTSIGGSAFDSCNRLTSIYFYNPDIKIPFDAGAIPSSATIYGYADSTAQIYAEEFGKKFELIGEASGDETLTTVPVITSATSPSRGTATITWSKVKNATSYKVYLAEAESKLYKNKVTVSTDSCTIGGLDSGTYKIRIKALVHGGWTDLADCECVSVTVVGYNDVEILDDVETDSGDAIKRVDFNGDGAITRDDAIYLLYHSIFGEEEYPLVK